MLLDGGPDGDGFGASDEVAGADVANNVGAGEKITVVHVEGAYAAGGNGDRDASADRSGVGDQNRLVGEQIGIRTCASTQCLLVVGVAASAAVCRVSPAPVS